ncbi:flagellar hook assembly protein FlgD [Aquabacterium sp. OR-4]|uniref:flagellar hook assembly protein FlgD n=1 Tax=Aquabacterium sp. OR-4 TaxID=2978127 RepID=UPI0028C5592C|nr:flagellar hook capping FlgD N-terminal domain-containing protein [Aquabacterium sp. OR-4]MDT7836193.1 flagellar hook capping FlgD N-terminal domain-containing protein [Aquabacterium sp. OR-4]
MTTTTSSTSLSTDFSSFNTGSTVAAKALTAQEQQDRFLKLLTTQLTNQDPLDPMDNAQMTSQMAQISTVSGIESMNASISKLASQFVSMQALQGASLVGHDVMVEGDRLAMDGNQASGLFELSASADSVKVEVLNSAGTVVKSVSLGAQASGQQDFSFQASDLETDGSYRFRITASTAGTSVSATPLMLDKVNAVSTSGGTLNLSLEYGGTVSYDAVKSVH